jgi:hypothetical protein
MRKTSDAYFAIGLILNHSSVFHRCVSFKVPSMSKDDFTISEKDHLFQIPKWLADQLQRPSIYAESRCWLFWRLEADIEPFLLRIKM